MGPERLDPRDAAEQASAELGHVLDGAFLLNEDCRGARWDAFDAFLGTLAQADFPPGFVEGPERTVPGGATVGVWYHLQSGAVEGFGKHNFLLRGSVARPIGQAADAALATSKRSQREEGTAHRSASIGCWGGWLVGVWVELGAQGCFGLAGWQAVKQEAIC